MRRPLDKTLSVDEPSRPFDRSYAGVVLFDAQGRCIAQQRTDDAPVNPGGITHFGGAREPGEAYADCAARELFEELRLKVSSSSLTLLGFLDIKEEDGAVTRCAFFVLRDVDVAKLELHEGKAIVVEAPADLLHEPRLSLGARLALEFALQH